MDLAFDIVTKLAAGVLLTPLAIFLFLILLGRKVNRYRGILAAVMMFACFVTSCVVFSETWDVQAHHARWEWFTVGTKSMTVGLLVDNLTAFMMVMVTLVSFLVHLFSIEYLRGEQHFEKYFAYLGLFTFSMLGILLSDNLFSMFVFWELAGLSSYLLIGFWFKKPSAVHANKKAFLVNKVGDIGFLVGLLVFWAFFGTLDLAELKTMVQGSSVEWLANNHFWYVVGCLGLFLGCVGKSAQFPLQIWLPNAMEGPTPVSALMHAATMVAAGVYLLARVFVFLPSEVLMLIAFIGAITAFMGGVAAMGQNDIKRVLAFSTISQLGYMVMAMGVQAYEAALFHLLTHAFFKACLFLGAGAVIDTMHMFEHRLEEEGYDLGEDFDPQDMRLMGGLWKKNPVNFITYMVAAASLAGLPFFSGFLSKDLILLRAWSWATDYSDGAFSLLHVVPLLGFATVFLTAFYMGRQVFLVFFGEFRFEKLLDKFAGTSKFVAHKPLLMRIPVIILSVLSLGLVFSWSNPFSADASWFLKTFQQPFSIVPGFALSQKEHFGRINELAHHLHWPATIWSIGLVLVGIGLSYMAYMKNGSVHRIQKDFSNTNNLVVKVSRNNWYLDELYYKFVVYPFASMAKSFAVFDRKVVNGVAELPVGLSLGLSRIGGWFDKNVVDWLVNLVGYKNVIIGVVLAWWDKAVVDGLVRLSALLSKLVGHIGSSVQGGKIQQYFVASMVGGALLIALLVW